MSIMMSVDFILMRDDCFAILHKRDAFEVTDCVYRSLSGAHLS